MKARRTVVCVRNRKTQTGEEKKGRPEKIIFSPILRGRKREKKESRRRSSRSLFDKYRVR
jgi:hypothetical protein